MAKVLSGNLGYPQIEEHRVWKRALKAFWAGNLGEADFLLELEQIRLNNSRRQQEKGIDLIPVGDFTLYDRMLDMAVMFVLVPAAVQNMVAATRLVRERLTARGSQS